MSVLPPLAPDRTRRDWTADELRALPDDGSRYEIVDGELLVTPAPSWMHQGAVVELFALLRTYTRQHGLHCLVAPADVPFSRTTVVEPDVFVVPRRPDGSLPADFHAAGRLVLAVEVISPSTARADRYVKHVAYLANGVPDYWIVDTANRFVERWRLGDDAPDVHVESLTWAPAEGVEPLVIDLAAYFRRVHGEDGGT